MQPLLLNSKQFFELKLKPVLRADRFKRLKVQYRVYYGPTGDPLGDEYFLPKATSKQRTPYGFEPYTLRQAVGDDATRLAEFLLPIGLGRLHPSIFAYLLSPHHQNEIKRGAVQGFPALVKTGSFEAAPDTPSDKLTKDFDEAVELDTDYKRVARKKNFDLALEKRILGERPHLLEGK